MSNNFAGLTISEPMDWDYYSPASWSTDVMISSSGRSRFVVTEGGIVPMAGPMLPPILVGGDFGLSFISQSGATHFVEYTTNLVTGPWMPASNFPGDGTTNLFMAPATNPAAYYRIETQ